MEESTLDKIRTRPRFKLYSTISPEDFENNLNQFLKKNTQFSGNVNREVATINVRTDEIPYWKPFLSLRAEKEDGKTVIRGIFAPSSSIWTFFMFLYFILGILWMVFVTMWFVGRQIKSDDYSWGLPVSIVVLAAIFVVYLSARFGQKKAKNEMAQLRKFAEESTLKFEEPTLQQ